MTTASAPVGSGAPVMIPSACPGPTEGASCSIQSPAFTSPTTSSCAGTSAMSDARTAYPSRVARGKGGKSRSAEIGSASTRPKPASKSTVSVSPGDTAAACCSTRCRASSKLTTPAEGTTAEGTNKEEPNALEDGRDKDMQESYAARPFTFADLGPPILVITDRRTD